MNPLKLIGQGIGLASDLLKLLGAGVVKKRSRPAPVVETITDKDLGKKP